MGTAIAHRMVEAGAALTWWNRSQPNPVDPLLARAATRVDAAAEALALPISFSMLADDAAAEFVLSETNIGTTLGSRIHVNMATVSAQSADRLSQRFAEAGMTYVAAPVLGRPDAAAAGKLHIVVAGPRATLDKVDPLLAACSVRRWRVGEHPRQANAVKIAMNLMLLQAIESIGESVALVEAEGVAATEFVEMFTHSLFGGVAHTLYGRIIAERKYIPAGFTLALGRKDLELAELLAAESKVDLATASIIRNHLDRALADPTLSDHDWSAIAEISRRPTRSG